MAEESAVELGLLTSHPSAEVRLAAVESLRALRAEEVDRFFNDRSVEIREAAIKAAYDEGIEAALPSLARLAPLIARSIGAGNQELLPIAQRAVYAAWRTGREADLAAVITIARDRAIDGQIRRTAVDVLNLWNEPPAEDPFLGIMWKFSDERVLLKREALSWLGEFLKNKEEAKPLWKEFTQLARQFGYTSSSMW